MLLLQVASPKQPQWGLFPPDSCIYVICIVCACVCVLGCVDQDGLSEGGVRILTLGLCCVNSVQQGASDTQSKRTDETERDSAAEHR